MDFITKKVFASNLSFIGYELLQPEPVTQALRASVSSGEVQRQGPPCLVPSETEEDTRSRDAGWCLACDRRAHSDSVCRLLRKRKSVASQG